MIQSMVTMYLMLIWVFPQYLEFGKLRICKVVQEKTLLEQFVQYMVHVHQWFYLILRVKKLKSLLC
jgi:hypothetical protein